MAFHFRLLLVFALCTISAYSDQLLYSIDCGTSATSVSFDSNFITWTGDSDLFQNGTSIQMVQSVNTISDVMDTLRVFNNNRKKNCYNFKIVEGTKVLVRASFNYGNYDKKSSPPSFDLLFDENFWDTVETTNTGVVYHEVIYVVQRSYLTVCLAQTTPNQFPFISALEIRSLGPRMYLQVNSTVALFLRKRVAFGATSSIRLVDDIYDRIWEPAKVGSGQVKVSNDAILIDDNYLDHPPQAVLENAITTLSTSQSLVLDMGFPSTVSQAYINWYFSEVTELDVTQTRSFQIFMNNRSISQSILPPYQNLNELYVSKFNVPSNAIFSLVATTDSDLPPIINAMEVFTISDILTEGTDVNDILGVITLAAKFSVLRDWGGDPCLPLGYSWEWVNCSSDDVPRITEINLSGFGLVGLIPDISTMDALETINLQNNNLVGPIPDFLGSLPKLKHLNVANNKLSGPIPTSLSKNNNLDFIWTGNPSLCTSGCKVNETPGFVTTTSSTNGGGKPTKTRTSSKKSKTWLIIGITIPSFIVLWAIAGLIIVLRKQRNAAVTAGIAGANRPQGNRQGGSGNGINSERTGDTVSVPMKEFTNNVGPTGGQPSYHPQLHG